MRKYILSLLCLVSMTVTGCNYLNMVPEKDIETIESIFERKVGVDSWWTALHGKFKEIVGDLGYYASYVGTDEYIASEFIHKSTIVQLGGLKIAAGLQMSQQPYCSIWAEMYQIIRNCNIFLENIHRCQNISDQDRLWLIADTKALKAHIYFELVRTYGPICLVDRAEPVDKPVEYYQLPRQPVDVCFKHITDLLDEAAPNIPMFQDRQEKHVFSFSLESVHALKAKALLYAASPLFNGNIFYSDFKNKNGELLFSQTYDKEKWRLAAEAADKAAEICSRGDRKLYKGQNNQKNALLNKMHDIQHSVLSKFDNPEFLLEAKINSSYYGLILPRLEKDEVNFDASVYGCLSPSMTMVEMFYTENGLPIDEDPRWNYASRHKSGTETSKSYEGVLKLSSEVVNLHLKREPRFYASIAGDQMYFQRGKSTPTADYNLFVQPYKNSVPWGTHLNVISSSAMQNITGYWIKKGLDPAVPTNNFGFHLTATETVPILRLAELYLMQAEAWNEYLEVPDDRVWDPLNKVRERAGIPTVQTSWGSISTSNKHLTKDGMRKIIRQECDIELSFEGVRYWNIRRWMIAPEVMNKKQYCWNILGDNRERFYNDWKGPAYEVDRYKFIAPRDYLAPIRAEEILISGMRQNPGWGGNN